MDIIPESVRYSVSRTSLKQNPDDPTALVNYPLFQGTSSWFANSVFSMSMGSQGADHRNYS